MTCFHPLPAYRSAVVNPATGKRGLVFNSKSPLRLAEGLSLSVPCGRCIGCRLDRSRDWAVRCMHEAQLYEDNCFLTLTYDDEHLPAHYSVDIEVHQKFIRALRDSIKPRIRFFGVGEYGDENLRPHYHYLIFNYRPSDLKLHSAKDGIKLYTSEKISKLWNQGFCTVGNVTYKTAAYCARYTMKKVGGDRADEHYLRVHPLSGQLCHVVPEFAKQSLRPGIGDAWYAKFKSDIYPSDFCVVDGKKHPVPKYYVKKLEEEERAKVKRARKRESLKHKADYTPARLAVREVVQAARAAQLKRSV